MTSQLKKMKDEKDDGGKTKSSTSRMFIGEELTIEILLRVHAKTLYRSKVVSRNWLSWISNQSFISRFIRRAKLLPPSLTGLFCRVNNIFEPDGGKSYFLNTSESNDSFVVVDNTLSFLTASQGPVIIIDSNNGLLLCAKKPHNEVPSNPIHYILCNPVTKQWVALPEPRYCDYTTSALLHCYNGDVDGSCAQKTECMIYCFHKKKPHLLEVEIYSSETGKWKRPKIYHYVWTMKEFTCITLFNGSAYWLQEDEKIGVCDLEAETLRVIELSPAQTNLHRSSVYLGESAGSLYFVQRSHACFFVWVLVDGGGFLLHQSIDAECLVSDFYERESRFYFKFLGIDPVNYKLFLAEINPFKAVLCCLDKNWPSYFRVLDPNIICNRHLKVFPYYLPAWPTCIPCIKNN